MTFGDFNVKDFKELKPIPLKNTVSARVPRKNLILELAIIVH